LGHDSIPLDGVYRGSKKRRDKRERSAEPLREILKNSGFEFFDHTGMGIFSSSSYMDSPCFASRNFN
jgi:hypothetical protein